MNRLYPQLMHHMDQLLSLIEFNSSIELGGLAKVLLPLPLTNLNILLMELDLH